MRQAAAQQHNDDDDARDPPHHEPETLAPVAPGRDLGHVRTRRQAAFTPTINVLYQPQREPSAAPPSRDPWRTEIEGGASPGGADFSDVEQGRVSGRSLFILSHSLPLALGRRCLTAPCPGPMAYRACAGAILFNRAGHLLIGRRNTTKFEAVRSMASAMPHLAPETHQTHRASMSSVSLRAHHHSGSSHKVALRPERPSKTQRCVRPRRSSAFRVPTYVVCCLVRVLELCDVATARRLNESLTRERRCNSSRRSIKSGNTKLLRRVG